MTGALKVVARSFANWMSTVEDFSRTECCFDRNRRSDCPLCLRARGRWRTRCVCLEVCLVALVDVLQVELEATACYGIRVYTNTSWLANHVDTRATHAVSLIMQVDQVRRS